MQQTQTQLPSDLKLDQTRRTQTQVKVPSKVKKDETRKMMALQFYGKENVKMEEVNVPLVTDPTDAVVKVTATTICGSDLHLYHNKIPEVLEGDILGHEAVGTVDQVGPEVTKFKKGDRVVISSIIACGQCDYCKRKEWSCCDVTNTSQSQVEMYGHHVCGFFGYSHMMGGYDGCQAEYVRVPFGDVNLFPIPDDVTDKQALVISDIASITFHGAELADVKDGDNVVIFGCGPVGLLAQMWSKCRRAACIVAIDINAQRLDFAKTHFGSCIINAKSEDPLEAVKKIFPNGPDKIIDCVGFRFPDSPLYGTELTTNLETGSSNILNMAIKMVRKNGRITLIGDYVGYTNHVNTSALMEKHLTINGGESWAHNDYKLIFEAIRSKKIDPSVIFTHTYSLSKCDEVYKMLDKHEQGIIKPFLIPDSLLSESGL